MKIVVENIFMCLVLFWKCYFPTNFSHFLGYFLNIQTNFITKNFKITAKSQHHTPPKLQFNPRQQTPAIKSHNHQNTTTTPPQQQQKSKSQREIGGSKIDGSKARSKARSIVRLERAILASSQSSDWSVRSGLPLDRRTGACDLGFLSIIGLERAIVRLEHAIWCMRSSDWSSGFTDDIEGVIWALSLSLSLRVWPENGLKWKIDLQTISVVKGSFSRSTSNNFRKIYFPCATKHPHLRKSISGSGLKSKQTQP